VTNASTNPEPAQGLADEPVSPAARQRLFALLREELANATEEALARGVPAHVLAAYLDERIALLRGEIAPEDQCGL
jgi:hypothetical protein